VHRSRALAAASATLLLLATAARGRQSLNPIERRVSRSIYYAITCVKTNCGGVQPPVRGVVASLFGAILALTANAASADEPLKLPDSQLEPVKWTQVAGWTTDDHLAAFAAYQASCQALRKTRRTDDGRRLSGALWSVCHQALGLRPQHSDTARTFFEQNFQPVRIARLGETQGFLTGYYEPVVQGSRFPSPEFHVPLYRRPPDLVAVGYKPSSKAFPNKGARIGRRNEQDQLVPYHDRGAIEAGALDGQKLEICWLKDPFDLLALQIEGSGRVILEDGTPLRINYDSHNGYSFSSISRALIERNLIPREEMSMQRIREWMASHPDEAAKVRAANRSYVFFRITGLSNEGEPVGAQGVPLMPGRSIAVDRLHEYGTPFFIDAKLPIESAKPTSAFRRLMIAQDTGSAIVGPARADLYLGAGDDAARIAGRIRHPGRFVMLLPRELDMVAAGKHMPLPVPKPNVPELAAVSKQEQGKVDSADEPRSWTRKPPPRDCAIAGIDCGRELGPLVATSKPLATTGQGLARSKEQQPQQPPQQHQQQQRAQSGLQGRGPDQQQPGTPQQKQQAAAEHRGPQQKRQPSTDGRGPQQTRPLQAMGDRSPQSSQLANGRGPQHNRQAPTTDGRGG
jgi:membrane-bound lytic murein transglycosylase A